MDIFLNKSSKKKSQSQKKMFFCEKCDYTSDRKYNIEKHRRSKSHILNQKVAITTKSSNEQIIEEPTFSCLVCNKTYKNRSGLWHHKKKCPKQNPDKNLNDENNIMILSSDISNNLTNVNVICELIKQNQEFKNLLIEQNNKIIELAKEKVTINNTNITNNFNLNMFLNEKCNNALNIMDFVNSLKIKLEDLEDTGKIGYVNGISKIFLRGLKELDVYKRPIHCSDSKRETLYIKDNNIWEKDEDKKKVKQAIQKISNKNFDQLSEWIKKYPEAKDIETKKHDEYMKILIRCTGGIDKNEDEHYYSKIIKNLIKEVIIDKNDK
jgi:hypothetical protein